MENPITVEVTRGQLVESRHRGMAVVIDAEGAIVFSAGDVDSGVFPRSACKAMQALPLVESGAADAYGFGNRELALACASHSGEPEHVATAAFMLKAAGRDESVLECGAHWSSHQHVLIDQARTLDKPTALHNNCSGKHSGFVCTCCHTGEDPRGYAGFDHPLQEAIRAIMTDLTGAVLSRDNCGTDGCSIPTYAVPLTGLARGFGKLVTGKGLEPLRAAAARRLINACMAEPFYVAGTKRFCTKLMQVAPGRIFAKTGAEGVFCALLPDKGLSFAVKAEDGATRAAEAMIAALLARHFDADSEERAALMTLAHHGMSNWNGMPVGAIRTTDVLFA
ncbi:MAG: asparaginase [Alphaproteobacteria bacterium]|jgi:L-asparaginase II|uniref:asparaginase n=1 Tax=Rhizobium/Agrobacterium group TaxID=227290 RepID=UPI0006BA0AA4|nr:MULTISPECIES: asparaginase [Rhizobium/Agrobacterium group]MBU0736838.1 asparaginase [Alphaproteobacteria bacterium]AOG10936.1 L-asparaginase II family protein [Agrobacterium sp. RAC06]KPF53568.1 asparaginase [Rhizobium sp. AAP116]MBU0831692.1 asparaginase [Alphaproteobacteria bacterium]MBU1766450.1 asparaginase [Alphaproteobacteria bacterium]